MTKKILKIALLSTLGFVSTNAISAADSVMGRMISIADKALGGDSVYSHEGDKQLVAARAFAALSKAHKEAVDAKAIAEARASGLETELGVARETSERALVEAREAAARGLAELRAEIEGLTARLQALTLENTTLKSEKAAQAELNALEGKELEAYQAFVADRKAAEEAAAAEAAAAEAAAEAKRVAIEKATESVAKAKEALEAARKVLTDVPAGEEHNAAREAAQATVAANEESVRKAEEALAELNAEDDEDDASDAGSEGKGKGEGEGDDA